MNRNYIEKSKAILEDMKHTKWIDLSGDGRCDSPVHNAKCLTYSFMDMSTNKIGAFSQTQFTEAGNSNRMEKIGFEKALKSLKDEGIVPEQITADRRVYIRKYLKEEATKHNSSSWCLALWKKYQKEGACCKHKTSRKILEKWIKWIENHF